MNVATLNSKIGKEKQREPKFHEVFCANHQGFF